MKNVTRNGIFFTNHNAKNLHISYVGWQSEKFPRYSKSKCFVSIEKACENQLNRALVKYIKYSDSMNIFHSWNQITKCIFLISKGFESHCINICLVCFLHCGLLTENGGSLIWFTHFILHLHLKICLNHVIRLKPIIKNIVLTNEIELNINWYSHIFLSVPS